ncbi:hypothetical protein MIR68_012391 [Amoeboaphelidium protococcarum]|nr:hypothetical protein MIR68_012391 [Amoeboaphelidium protococcarum]
MVFWLTALNGYSKDLVYRQINKHAAFVFIVFGLLP